jgi:phytoene synthase
MTPNQTAYKKSSFGPAFLFLGKKQRRALADYYAFCRLMDDIADEPTVKNPQRELDFWREEIVRVFEQKATTDLGRDLQKTVVAFDIERDRFLQLIDGMQADVQGRLYQTTEELEWYLWHVAGIVGLATLDILGVKGPKAQQLARSLGFAVQITNIIRDVHEDASVGRVYIPVSLLEQYGLSRADILKNSAPQKTAQVLKVLAAQAHTFYTQAEKLMNSLPARKMLPCRVMELVYRKNLAKIEKRDFVFEKPIKLSKAEKIKYAVYAFFKAPVF